MEINDVIKIFKENAQYDAVDEKTFETEQFKEKEKELLLEKEDFDDNQKWEEYVIKAVSIILNFCQYGDTSDFDDMLKISNDLKKRGLYEVRIKFM